MLVARSEAFSYRAAFEKAARSLQYFRGGFYRIHEALTAEEGSERRGLAREGVSATWAEVRRK
jgi:hypothetical protein